MAKKKIRIFISSPGDVYQERITAKKVIAELNKIYSKYLEIEPILWEDMPLLVSSTFQDGIDEIIKQYNIDIAVFILWSRLGTPLNKSYLKKDGSFYQSGTEYELDLMLQSFEKSGHPRILVYVKNEPLKKRLIYESEENLQEVISQHRAVKSFIKEHFHDEESGSNYAYTSFGGDVSFESRLKSHLKGIIADYLGNKMTSIKWHRNPYVGLNSFDYTESDIFFGREKAINDIMANALTHMGEGHMPSIVLLGESGSGKSSLVQAGVVPMMDYIEGSRGKLLKVIPSLLGENIYETFVELFLSTYPFLQETPIAEELRKGIDEDYNFAHLQYALSKERSSECPIFFLDQFEELFSDARISDDQRKSFLRLIRGLVGTRQVFIILSMRNDFYSYFHSYKDFNLVKETATLVYDIPLLGSLEYTSIIKEPAKLAGVEWEINDNGQALDEMIINDAIELKSLPLIQFSLYELYKIRDEENSISYENYQSIGGIKGAFLSYANSVYQQLSAAEVLALNDILSKTITTSNLESETFVRKTSLLREVEISDIHRNLVKKLVDAHILVSSKNSNGEPTVTLVHEMLINSWPIISQWIESEKYFIKESGYYEKRAIQWIESGAKSGGVIKDEEQLLRAEYFDYWWATKSVGHVRDYIKASLDYRRKLGITRWSIYIFAYSWFAYMALSEYSLSSISGITSFLAILLLFVPLCLNLALHITKRQTYKTVKIQFVTWVSFLILNIIIDILDRSVNPQDYLNTSGMWLNYLLYIIFFCATLSSYQQYKVRYSWKNRKFKIPLTIRIFNKERYKIVSTLMNSLFVVLFILGLIFGWNGIMSSNRFDSAVVMNDYLTQTLENSQDELSCSFFYKLNELREIYLKDVYYDSVDVICYPNPRKEELAKTFYYRSMPDSALLYLSNDTSVNANLLHAKIYSQLGLYKEASDKLDYSPEVLYPLLQSSVIMNEIEPVSIYIMGGAFQKARKYLNYIETNLVGYKDSFLYHYCKSLYSVAVDKGAQDDIYYNYVEKAIRDTLQHIPVSKLLLSNIISSEELKLLREKSGLDVLIEKYENVPNNLLGEWCATLRDSDCRVLGFILIINKSYMSAKVIEFTTIDGSLIENASDDLISESTIYHFVSPASYDSEKSCIIATSANLFEQIGNSTIINVNDYMVDSFNANISFYELAVNVDSLDFSRIQ